MLLCCLPKTFSAVPSFFLFFYLYMLFLSPRGFFDDAHFSTTTTVCCVCIDLDFRRSFVVVSVWCRKKRLGFEKHPICPLWRSAWTSSARPPSCTRLRATLDTRRYICILCALFFFFAKNTDPLRHRAMTGWGRQARLCRTRSARVHVSVAESGAKHER